MSPVGPLRRSKTFTHSSEIPLFSLITNVNNEDHVIGDTASTFRHGSSRKGFTTLRMGPTKKISVNLGRGSPRRIRHSHTCILHRQRSFQEEIKGTVCGTNEETFAARATRASIMDQDF